MILTFLDFLNEEITPQEKSLLKIKDPLIIVEPFIDYFKTKAPFLKTIKGEQRFQYQNFKIAIHYKLHKIQFVFVKRPDNKIGLDFLKNNGFPNFISDLEKNALKIGENKKSRAKIYFF